MTDDLATAQFKYTFKPRTPCGCEKPYCNKTSAGCDCQVPSNFNVSKSEVVYTKPQDCNPFALVTKWTSVSYDLGGTTTNEACPAGYKFATVGDRSVVIPMLEQAMKSYVWPKVKAAGGDDADMYYCPEGVKYMQYPGNIGQYKSCISKVSTRAFYDYLLQFLSNYELLHTVINPPQYLSENSRLTSLIAYNRSFLLFLFYRMANLPLSEALSSTFAPNRPGPAQSVSQRYIHFIFSSGCILETRF